MRRRKRKELVIEGECIYHSRGQQLFRLGRNGDDYWINSGLHEQWYPVLFDEGPHPSFALDYVITEQEALELALKFGMSYEAFYELEEGDIARDA